MQVELLDTPRWRTRVELANAIFECIEIFHNRRRRHTSLGMRTPIEFELININTRGVQKLEPSMSAAAEPLSVQRAVRRDSRSSRRPKRTLAL